MDVFLRQWKPHMLLRSLSISTLVAGVLFALGLGLATPRGVQAQDETFMVNSKADAPDDNPGDGNCATSGGACTLRAAIDEANSDGNRDKVDFSSISTTNGFATISINSELEATEEINIAGETAPNYPSSSANGPIVKLDGSNISGASADGIEFDINASGSRVAGLAVVSMPDEGIDVRKSSVLVEDCFVGVDVDGETVQGNNRDPDPSAAGVRIIDDGTVQNNVVSGNDGTGILIDGNSAEVLDNTVGLDSDGDTGTDGGGTDLGNGDAGIRVDGNQNLVGNAYITLPFGVIDNGNVVSNNVAAGIVIEGDENEVFANEVGTSADSSSAFGNGGNGIVVKGPSSSDAAENNLIGDAGFDGNLISGNDRDGIALGDNSSDLTSSQDTVRNNVIGLNASEDAALPNGASTSTDGGIVGSRVKDAVIDSNLVAGNAGQGIIIFTGSGNSEDIDIVDNIVGTNRNFATGLGNEYDGIQVRPNPGSNIGEVHVAENIVGNNENDGIDIRGSYHDVYNNYIGVAPDGSDIGNGANNQGVGVKIDNGASTLTDLFVGSDPGGPGNGLAAGNATPAGKGNVIGNNRLDGILLRGGATDVNIGENYVGTNPSGADLGNGGTSGNDGIRIVESGNTVSDVEVGYNEGETISSPDPADGGEGNVVAYNAGDGISAGSDESTTDVSDVTVSGNVVYQNGAANDQNIGFDLGNSGQTNNDAGDTDSGPNGLQNFPTIQDVTESNEQVTIDYEVKTNDTGSNYPLTVDFYAADSEQSGEGKIYLGSQDYTSANTTASVSFDLNNFSNVSSDDYFVATATDDNGNTSEFFGPLGEQLPVELASFDGSQSGDQAVELSWKTTSETNNAGFVVQRRKVQSGNDSKSESASWTKVGFVESKAAGGTTTETTTYRLMAEDLKVGTHKFRLKQRDLDGTTHLHDPITVDLQMQEALQLGAPAPNPVQGQATLSFAVKDQAEATITLYNTLGQKVRTVYRGTPSAGEAQTARLSTDGLSSGVYFLRMRADGQSKTQRVTVVK
jgi:CSLREA domain-containing protein